MGERAVFASWEQPPDPFGHLQVMRQPIPLLLGPGNAGEQKRMLGDVIPPVMATGLAFGNGFSHGVIWRV